MTGTKISEQTIGFDHEARLGILETKVDDTRITIADKIAAEKEATALALASTGKATDVALQTAERAAAKADLAADKIYLESQISNIKESFRDHILGVRDTLQALILSQDKAIQKAEAAAEKRFESVNEFRATLSDQQRDLATKSEVNLRFTAIEERLTMSIENAREMLGRGQGLAAGWGYLVGAIGIGAAIVTLVVLLVKTAT